MYESISTVTDHDIFQNKNVTFDPQVKVGMESRFYIDWNQFQFMMFSKRGHGMNDVLQST